MPCGNGYATRTTKGFSHRSGACAFVTARFPVMGLSSSFAAVSLWRSCDIEGDHSVSRLAMHVVVSWCGEFNKGGGELKWGKFEWGLTDGWI